MTSANHQSESGTTPRNTTEIPELIRAAAGLAATLLDQARNLPTAITGLPVKVAGIAMQSSLRLQQRYAGLIVKGDELLTQLNRSDDAAPPWATFDDEVVDMADAVSEDVGVDVTAAQASAPDAADVALPPLPRTARGRTTRDRTTRDRTTRDRTTSRSSATPRIGHAPSAFDLAKEVPPSEPSTGSGRRPDATGDIAPATQAPVPGYDAFTLAQVRARLRTFDAATLQSLLDYERHQHRRAPFITMLENRLNRSLQRD